MKTRRLFKENVYLKTAEAKVSTVAKKDGKCLITLDQTIFFPTGGGQSCDVGTIILKNSDECIEYTVSDVYEYDSDIFHQVELPNSSTPLLEVGDSVQLFINWEHRFDNMQRHCGEHILSGMCYREFNGINRGFHMGEDYMTIDMSIEASPLTELTWDIIRKVEMATNKVIWENLPVITTHYDHREDAAHESLRKDLTIEKDITIVRIGELNNPSDAVACCGTHPSTSGQVGMLKIYKVESNKGMYRIYFDAGKRAFLHYQQEFDILNQMSNRLSAGFHDIIDKFQSRDEKFAQAKDRIYQLEKLLISSEANKLLTAEPSNFLAKTYNNLTADNLIAIGKQVTSRSTINLLALISAQDNLVFLFTHKSSEVHCGNIAKTIGIPMGAKGGGDKTMARIKFPDTNVAKKFISTIENLQS